jgi:hypothetical protein
MMIDPDTAAFFAPSARYFSFSSRDGTIMSRKFKSARNSYPSSGEGNGSDLWKKEKRGKRNTRVYTPFNDSCGPTAIATPTSSDTKTYYRNASRQFGYRGCLAGTYEKNLVSRVCHDQLARSYRDFIVHRYRKTHT